MGVFDENPVVKWIVILAGTVIFLAGIKAMGGLAASASLALVIAVGVAPAQQWLIDRKVPGVLAFILVLLGSVLVVLVVFGLLGYSLASFISTMPKYATALSQLTAQFIAWLQRLGIDLSSAKSGALNPNTLLSAAKVAAQWVGQVANQLVTVVILFAFMLLDAPSMTKKISRYYPGGSDTLAGFSDRMRKWAVLTTFVNAGVAVGNTIILYLLGIDYALLWGLLSFFLGFIPNVGFLISLVPPTLLALLQYGPQKALVVIISYIVINGAVSNIATPKLMGEGLNLSPFIVMFSLFFWAILLGPLGAILAIPLTLTAKLGLEQSPDTARFAALMGGPPVEEVEAAK